MGEVVQFPGIPEPCEVCGEPSIGVFVGAEDDNQEVEINLCSKHFMLKMREMQDYILKTLGLDVELTTVCPHCGKNLSDPGIN